MKLIVGLGNPGNEYENTRHNVGFMAIKELACAPEIIGVEKKALEFNLMKKFSAEVAYAQFKGEKILLAKPMTFMNQSGEAIAKIAGFYKIDNKNIWIIVDDIEIPLGKIRVRLTGSTGGHKGIESIIDNLTTNEFARIRVGIGPVEDPIGTKRFAKEFVLDKFSKRELPQIEQALHKVKDIIVHSLSTKANGLEAHTIDVGID